MTARRPLVLVGFMASGKSTVGRLVAERAGLRFLDLDKVIEASAKMSTADIFAAEGEPGFRLREAAALKRVLAETDVVIATGGGAVSRPENLEAMLGQGLVVALEVPAEEVLRRVGTASGRPMLDRAADPLVEARRLLAERQPFYARAHARVDTAGRSASEVADQVLAIARQQTTGTTEGEQS